MESKDGPRESNSKVRTGPSVPDSRIREITIRIELLWGKADITTTKNRIVHNNAFTFSRELE